MEVLGRKAFAKYTDKETFDKIVEFETVCEMWKTKAKEYSKQIAITDDGKEYSYAEIDKETSFYRNILAENGVKKGDRVALFCANSYQFVKAFLSIVTVGATAVILPAHLDEKSVYGCCMKFGAKTLVYGVSLEEKTVLSQKQGIMTLSTELTSNIKYPMANVKGDDECVIMFTGGTTGKSKGALLSQRAVMQGTVNGCYGIAKIFNQRYLLVLPLSHVFGLIRNLMTSLYTGSNLFICRNNKDMFKDIATFKPTIIVIVPALAEMALNLSKKFGKNMLGEDLKTIVCGAAAVAPYLIKEYDKMGVTLLAGYGLTESANLVSGNPENLKKPESVGIMYPNQEYKVVDGELWLKGKNMMTAYVGEDEENKTAYSDGWFKTGDLVRFDEDGFLYITGRKKEIIVLSNGENVSPAEVELKFNALSIVQDSQVFEDVTESGAHILALEVVPRMTELNKIGKDTAYLVKELEKINGTLPTFERVSKITVRETDFERTPSMKIVRYKKCN